LALQHAASGDLAGLGGAHLGPPELTIPVLDICFTRGRVLTVRDNVRLCVVISKMFGRIFSTIVVQLKKRRPPRRSL